jgi:hypothetical protein
MAVDILSRALFRKRMIWASSSPENLPGANEKKPGVSFQLIASEWGQRGGWPLPRPLVGDSGLDSVIEL